MKIHVDFSVFTTTGIAVGKVSGDLELAGAPPIGSTVVLAKPNFATSFPPVSGFTGHLFVEHLLLAPLPAEPNVIVSLEDMVLPTLADARLVMQFFAQGFGLDAYEYEPGRQ